MGQKKTFSDHFFSEEALSEEQLVRKFGKKNGGKTLRKKLDEKTLGPEIRRRPSDGRTQKFKSAFKHRPHVG